MSWWKAREIYATRSRRPKISSRCKSDNSDNNFEIFESHYLSRSWRRQPSENVWNCCCSWCRATCFMAFKSHCNVQTNQTQRSRLVRLFRWQRSSRVPRTSRYRWSWCVVLPTLKSSLTLISDTGAQPLINEDETLILAVNGEIYNHIHLKNELGPNVSFKTHSDCEVILPLVR